jgi:hypothetical protein
MGQTVAVGAQQEEVLVALILAVLVDVVNIKLRAMDCCESTCPAPVIRQAPASSDAAYKGLLVGLPPPVALMLLATHPRDLSAPLPTF